MTSGDERKIDSLEAQSLSQRCWKLSARVPSTIGTHALAKRDNIITAEGAGKGL